MKHLFNRIALIMFMILGMGGLNAVAQQVGGTVLDASGQPVIGAAVLVKGTTTGATTDIDGSFTLPSSVASDAILEVSCIGYETQEIALSGRTTLNIVMNEDALMLDDVVVVGYGVQKKAS